MVKLSKQYVERIYWSIGEVSIKINEPESRIRFWIDAIGMNVKTGSNNNRMINRKQIDQLHRVSKLVAIRFFTLDGVCYISRNERLCNFIFRNYQGIKKRL